MNFLRKMPFWLNVIGLFLGCVIVSPIVPHAMPRIEPIYDAAHYRQQFIRSFLRWSLGIVLFVTVFLAYVCFLEPQWTSMVLFLTFCQFPPCALWCLWLLRHGRTDEILPIYLFSGLIACTAYIIFVTNIFLLVGAIGYILFIRVTIFLKGKTAGSKFAAVCVLLYLITIFIRSTFTLPPIDFFNATKFLLYTLPILTFFLFVSMDQIGTSYLHDTLQFSEQARHNLMDINVKLVEQKKQLEQSQAELSEFASRLEETVAERTHELTGLLEEREQLSQKLIQVLAHEAELGELKSRIITTVSHEFRTPLTVISTSAALLKHHIPQPLTDNQQKHLARIHDSVAKVVGLLENINMVNTTSAIEGDSVEVVELPFNELCHRLREMMLLEIGHPEHIHFNFDEGNVQPIQVNAVFLKQVVSILFSNALKYGNGQTPVVFNLMADDTEMTVTTHDDGIGIPAADIEAIFDLFYRGSNVGNRPGVGVGLFIARRLIEMMDGRVTVASAGVGEGSTFSVKLPVVLDG